MSQRRIEFSVTLTVASPVLCQGISPVAQGIDSSFLRNQEAVPIISADQIKGLCRDTCRSLFPDQVVSLFGSGSGDLQPGDSLAPSRSRLIFSDLAATSTLAALRGTPTPFSDSRSSFTRIQIDDETGAAKDGQLQVIEMIAEPGTLIVFTGSLIAYVDTDQGPETLGNDLQLMLATIPAIGAFKSIGFGEVRGASLVPKNLEPCPKSRALAQLPERIRFAARFDRPVLFDADRVEDNIFRGSLIAPGAVVKGALATRLAREGKLDGLSSVLSEARISHAFPMTADGQRLARSLPLSLARAGNCTVDLLLCAHPESSAVINGEAVIFQPDWKPQDFRQATANLQWPTTDGLSASEQRTRTAIADGVAADQQLFVYQSVPSRVAGQEVEWMFEVLRGSNANDAEWGALIACLDQGLDQVGKTDATMTVRELDMDAGSPPPPLISGDRVAWAITLETPALLVDMQGPWDAAQQYTDYWSEALGISETPRLESYFAGENIRGGYLAMRRRTEGTTSYSPWLVTKAGSVFLLSVTRAAREEMERALERLAAHGLPLRVDANLKRRPTWEECPYVPENGYGAISFHHDDHLRLATGTQAWTPEHDT